MDGFIGGGIPEAEFLDFDFDIKSTIHSVKTAGYRSILKFFEDPIYLLRRNSRHMVIPKQHGISTIFSIHIVTYVREIYRQLE